MISLKKYPKLIAFDVLMQASALGSSFFYSVLFLVFLFTGSFSDALFLFFGLALVYVISFPIRIYFFRERPNKKKYENIIDKFSAGSMPSGHSARITFLFLFFVEFFEKNLIMILFLGVILLLVMLSRLYKKRHYISDLFGGVVVGGISYLILSLLFIG